MNHLAVPPFLITRELDELSSGESAFGPDRYPCLHCDFVGARPLRHGLSGHLTSKKFRRHRIQLQSAQVDSQHGIPPASHRTSIFADEIQRSKGSSPLCEEFPSALVSTLRNLSQVSIKFVWRRISSKLG